MSELDVEELDILAAAGSPRSRRSRLPARTRLDFWLDLAIFVAFTLDYAFRLTGLSVHEWIGLGFGLALIVHLTLHWTGCSRPRVDCSGHLPVGRNCGGWSILVCC